jgi:LAS superfamily LD-carboxypeptidase LdcB
MIQAAAADGVYLSGGGYRSPQAQIDLRRQHCGSSYYAIYQAPASSCSPPTAIPGTSMHERGLAIDFDNCYYGSSVYNWLSANAASYGLYNLPSESWHWSTTGT